MEEKKRGLADQTNRYSGAAAEKGILVWSKREDYRRKKKSEGRAGSEKDHFLVTRRKHS